MWLRCCTVRVVSCSAGLGSSGSSEHSPNGNANIVYRIFLDSVVSVECGWCVVLTLAHHEMCSVLLIEALCFLFAGSCMFCPSFLSEKPLLVLTSQRHVILLSESVSFSCCTSLLSFLKLWSLFSHLFVTTPLWIDDNKMLLDVALTTCLVDKVPVKVVDF